jgi:hypothetical protein
MDGEKKSENGSNPARTEKTVIEGRDPTGEQREQARRLLSVQRENGSDRVQDKEEQAADETVGSLAMEQARRRGAIGLT